MLKVLQHPTPPFVYFTKFRSQSTTKTLHTKLADRHPFSPPTKSTDEEVRQLSPWKKRKNKRNRRESWDCERNLTLSTVRRDTPSAMSSIEDRATASTNWSNKGEGTLGLFRCAPPFSPRPSTDARKRESDKENDSAPAHQPTDGERERDRFGGWPNQRGIGHDGREGHRH